VSLVDDAATFLEADGWSVIRRESDASLISAKRAGFGDASDQVHVWCASAPKNSGDLWRGESAMLKRFTDEAATPGQKFLLVETREGLSVDFQRQALRDFNVSIRVPIQFFDAPFKWDASFDSAAAGVAATAASRLRQRGGERAQNRTPQPFEATMTGASGGDLLTELVRRFASASEWTTPVLLVTAPAGFGKSVLFDSLYARLYEQFMTNKRQLQSARRPLPLLPEYIASASAPTLRGLVEAFLQTDVARPVRLESFEWMLTHGYASWLLDGLDEVISQDPHFFEYILDILTRPGSPRIVICVRDSLLSASQGLRDFISEAREMVTEFRLLPWGVESLRTFAKMRVLKEPERFTLALEHRKTLKDLCGTPYYAELVAEKFDSPAYSLPPEAVYTEIELLDEAVRSIIGREYEKGLLRLGAVQVNDVLELVYDVAVMELQSGTRGVSTEEIGELAAILLPDDLEDAERGRLVSQLQSLAVFRGTTEQGQVRFAQDVILEFLVGRRAGDYFRSNPSRFVQLLGWRPLPPDSLTLRVLKAQIESSGADDEVHEHLLGAAANPIAFRNLLQLVLSLARPERLLRQAPLERQDLSGIRFVNVDLDRVSLRGSNLESASFIGCKMAGCILAEATLHDTLFERSQEGLIGAEFGSLSGFISVSVDKKTHIDAVEEFLRVIGQKPGPSKPVVGPCPTAMQLRSLFLKFVRPDGQARRDWLDERAVVAGRRFVDPSGVLRAAVGFGFFSWESSRKRYERTRGQLYADMVGFSRNLQISPTISSLLQDCCKIPGCAHLVDITS
jgi:hypothetical protein